MTVIPLARKRFRFCIEEGHGSGERMMLVSIELESREALKLLSYMADMME
jgi:hypothetical protein